MGVFGLTHLSVHGAIIGRMREYAVGDEIRWRGETPAT